MASGFITIDLKDTSITIGGAPVKIVGIHERIEGNHRRATLITGLVLDGVECSDRWVNFRPTSHGFVGLIGFNDSYLHLMLNINADDEVSVFEE